MISTFARRLTAAFAGRNHAVTVSRPRWLLWITLATLGYLVVELAFNARLLDVVGGGASEREIERIEVWGRALSGFALALALWPALLSWAQRKHLRFVGAVTLLCFVSLTCMGTMYAAQEALVEALVQDLDAEERASAQKLVLLQRALLKSKVTIGGLELDEQALARPDGKAFLALFPVLGASLGDLAKRFPATQQEGVTRALLADRLKPQKLYADYQTVITRVAVAYSAYQKIDESYDAAIAPSGIRGFQDVAWERHVATMKKFNSNWPNTLPRSTPRLYIRQLRNSGINVSDDWVTTDRFGFYEAAAVRARAYAGEQRAAAMRSHLHEFRNVPAGLLADAFMRHADVQGAIRRHFNVPCLRSYPAYHVTPEAFSKHVVEPLEACLVKREMSVLDGSSEGSDAARESAARALIVPPLALTFSLLGAITHLVKSLLWSAWLVRGRPLLRGPWKWPMLAGSTVAVMLVLAVAPLSNITTQQLYGDLTAERAKAENGILVQAWVLNATLRATIHGQAVAYPMFEWLRVNALGGFEFGYASRSDAGAENEGK